MIGILVTVSSSGKPLGNAIAWFVGASIIPVAIAIAGLLLWKERNWISGCFVIAVMLGDLLIFGVATADAIGLVLRFVLLLIIANGVRGALALRASQKESTAPAQN
jgi:hypothetical protein